MVGRPLVVKRGSKGEAEKPFWISYADLMAALMVLFLVAMSVAMMAVTNSVKDFAKKNETLEQTAQEIARQKDALQVKTDEAEQRNEQLQTAMRDLQVATEKLKIFQKTPEEIERDRLKAERENEISRLLAEVAAAAKKHSGVKVDRERRRSTSATGRGSKSSALASPRNRLSCLGRSYPRCSRSRATSLAGSGSSRSSSRDSRALKAITYTT